METKEPEVKPDVEIDEKGVPLINRLREMERKLQEKHDKEITEMKSELAALRLQREEAEPEKKSELQLDAKTRLAQFVQDPDAYIEAKVAERERQHQKVEWDNQTIEAEKWIKSQEGFSAEDESKVYQIIKEHKLDTPYHWPIERAKTAWKLLTAEKRAMSFSADGEDKKREAHASRTSTEGGGKATPKKTEMNRADMIKKLSEAETKGDLDASIYWMNQLEDKRE